MDCFYELLIPKHLPERESRFMISMGMTLGIVFGSMDQKQRIAQVNLYWDDFGKINYFVWGSTSLLKNDGLLEKILEMPPIEGDIHVLFKQYNYIRINHDDSIMEE